MASAIGRSAETVTTLASGTMTWRTRKLGRSRTRLIIALSSEVKLGAASCMTKRNSSRLPKSRPVKALPPVQCSKPARKPGRHRHQRRQQPVNDSGRAAPGQREAIGIALEKRLGRQFADDVKNKHPRDKNGRFHQIGRCPSQ